MNLTRTANTPGNYEATTPSGLGATGASYSPMCMGSPALSTRSVSVKDISYVLFVLMQDIDRHNKSV